MANENKRFFSTYDLTAHLYSLFTGLLFIITGKTEKQFRKRIYLEFLPLKDDQKILDICCANGYGTRILASVFPKCSIDAIDLNPNMIDFAKRNSKSKTNINFQFGDCTRLGFPENHFDTLTAFLALHELPTTHLPKALEEISRVIKPGGYLLVFELNIPDPIPLHLRIVYFIFRLFEDAAAARFMITEQEKLIQRYGFKLIKKQNYFLGFGNAFLFQKI